MESLYLLMPISGMTVFWPGLVILGFGVGVLGAFFGMGGAWMVTPGLNLLGFPMAFAIGTDIAHMAGKSLVSTLRHGKFGNVDYRLGVIMIVGTILGFELGAQMVMWLERLGNVSEVVRWIYVALLAFITWMVYYDLIKRIKKDKETVAAGGKVSEMSTGVTWAASLHKIAIPPMVDLKVSGIYCSLWLPVFVSFMTGWLAGILGIGGGLIRMPSLIYFVGCPTHVAVGTDLFEVMISGIYGAGTYTYKGRTELVAAVIMLVGASIGAQIGAVATKYIKGYGIRIAFSFCVIGCLVSIAMRLAVPYMPWARSFLERGSAALVLAFVSAMAIYICIRMVQGAALELSLKKQARS